MSNLHNNNKVTLTGVIECPYTFSHEVNGEKFFSTKIEVNRLSGNVDVVPLLVSEYLGIPVTNDDVGKSVKVQGQFLSYNKQSESGKNSLILSVFVQEMWPETEIDEESVKNDIVIEGYICKKPVFRKKLSGYEITDLLIAVNRGNGKSDYIPCICWGRTARFAGRLKVADKIRAFGRIQSREYTKKIGEENYEIRVAYEVSIGKMLIIEE